MGIHDKYLKMTSSNDTTLNKFIKGYSAETGQGKYTGTCQFKQDGDINPILTNYSDLKITAVELVFNAKTSTTEGDGGRYIWARKNGFSGTWAQKNNLTTTNTQYVIDLKSHADKNGSPIGIKQEAFDLEICAPFTSSILGNRYNGKITASNIRLHFRYTLRDYEIILEDIEGATINSSDWTSNKKKFDVEDSFSLPTLTKPGYIFRGWSESKNGTPNLNVQIHSGTTGNKTYYAHFDPQIKRVTGRTEPEGAGIVKILKGSQDKNNADIAYSDDYYFDEIKVTYNNKAYKFKGWKYENGNSLDDSIIKDGDSLKNVKLSYEDDSNKYVAVLEQINYSFSVQMYNKDGNPEIFGELVTDHPKEDKSNISEREADGIFTLKNLKFGDERKLTIIPRRKSSDSQYYFKYWPETSNMIFPIKIDDSWISTKDTLMIDDKYFESFSLQNNSVTNSEEDSIVANRIVQKNITDFILKNQVNFLGAYAFYNCKDLKYLYMPGANSIGDHTFENCLELRQVVISSNRDGQIGIDTFKNCPKLNLLILPGNFVALNSLFSPLDDPNARAEDYPNVSPSLFGQKIGRIYVNPEFIDDYRESTTNWGIYSDIIFEINDKIYQGD